MQSPVLITTAIKPSDTSARLSNVDERLELTLAGLEQLIKFNPGVIFVVCDGSNFDFSNEIQAIAAKYNCRKWEFLRFQNDSRGVVRLGKGYGEGEIIKYALHNSRILAESEYFFKCTGKLWVENISEKLSGFNRKAAFCFYGAIRPKMIDTRFYLVEKKFYIEKLIDAHLSVSDRDGFYLEHSFLKILEGSASYSDYISVNQYAIEGVSGSMGLRYKSSAIKLFLKKVRALFLIYFIKPL